MIIQPPFTAVYLRRTKVFTLLSNLSSGLNLPGPKGKSQKAYLCLWLVDATRSDYQPVASSQVIEAEISQQAEANSLKLGVDQGTSLVGRNYTEDRVSEN